jgi:hypothetical protein
MANSSLSQSDSKVFLFRYYHQGSWYVFEIHATSMDDAQQRIKKLPLAQPMGELMAKIPASAGALVRCLCWLRNMWVSVRSAR